MIQGGIAGKLGNRYEAKWLVRSLIDVIADKAKWLKFESIETEYRGFEFAVARGQITEWHQTKIYSPKGNWTINALKVEGVLKAFSRRLSADKNAHCYFVSQDNAKDLRTLTEKARISNSYEQYFSALSDDEKKVAYQNLKKEWSQPDKILFDWLQRSHVEIIPVRELDSFIESYGDLHFHASGKDTFPILREILENHFNKTLTCEGVLTAIKENGVLKFKAWAFDQTISQRLGEETEAYLQTYTPFWTGGETIVRTQVKTLIDEITKPDSPSLVLLTGVAGSGKSGIVRGAIKHLSESKIPHLAFRVDQHLSCKTKSELGKILTDREESPISTLKGTFPDSRSVLFIDQVDAVSEVSGRDGQVKEVIFRLIRDAYNFGGVKVVVACRTFDLESDPRLKKLKETDQTTTINVPLLNWATEIEPLLKNIGVDVSSLNNPQRQLLRLPINLAVFLEIDDPEFSFLSLSKLHDKLIEKKQRTISRERKTAWSLIQVLTTMCDWMSQRQKLNAPATVLDPFSNAVDILTSEGMIISSRGQINFFHESFFDHIYARGFANKDQNLVNLITSTEQHLFRRTQVRQILEAMRQNDFSRYLIELSSVLSDTDKKIRFHIKVAISQWLSHIDKPSPLEFEIISKSNEPNEKFNQLFRNAVLSTHAWFDLLNEKGWIEQQINCEDKTRSESVLRWLFNVAGERPAEVSRLLRSWWGNDGDRALRLLNWFSHQAHIKHDDLQLCEDVINSHPSGLFHEESDHIRSLLYTLEQKSPERCGQILHSLFEAWSALNPGRNIFEKDEFNGIDAHSLSEIAEKSPQEFLKGTTDVIVHSIDMVIAEGETGRSGYYFNHRTYTGSRFGFDQFLGIYRTALKKVVQKVPETAITYLEKLDPHKHQALMHLYLESIQVNPSFLGDQLPKLATNEIVFDAGWNGANWLSFAKACCHTIPHLSTDEKKVIEKVILDYAPEIDIASVICKASDQDSLSEIFGSKRTQIKYYLSRSGHKQWCILETIGEELLSSTAISRLSELRRKFPDEEIKKPDNNGVYRRNSSSTKQVHYDKMTNCQWLSAFDRYSEVEDRSNGIGLMNGRTRKLARELQEATKKDPERFAALCLEIPVEAHSDYIKHILSGFEEIKTRIDDYLVLVVKHAHNHPQKPFGSNIADLLGRHPYIAANTEILEILIWYALYGEAIESEESDVQNTERETVSIDSLLNRGRTVHIRGINGARGMAWEALGSVLWNVPEAENKVWDAIKIALEKEKLISVRCSMMKPLAPLFNMSKGRFSDSIRRLIILPDCRLNQNAASRLSPLITHEGTKLFSYIFYWLPELADELVTELLESEDKTISMIGAWHIFRESFRNDAYSDKSNKLASISADHRMLLADITCGAINVTENRYRAEALLTEFFLDENEQVRKKAANVFSHVQSEEVELYRELAGMFLKSPAFADNDFSFLHMLKKATCDILDLVLKATQQVTTNITENKNQQAQHGPNIHTLQNLLKREYTSSESNTEAREKILDLIDHMLFHEIYGADNIVTAHDRW